MALLTMSFCKKFLNFTLETLILRVFSPKMGQIMKFLALKMSFSKILAEKAFKCIRKQQQHDFINLYYLSMQSIF